MTREELRERIMQLADQAISVRFFISAKEKLLLSAMKRFWAVEDEALDRLLLILEKQKDGPK